MLQLSTLFYNRKILSLRNGLQIGVAIDPLINPNNLKIEGWFVQIRGEKTTPILLSTQVRDFIHKGIVVDDYDALTDPEDLVRLKQVIRLHFDLLGKEVTGENGKKIGKVRDYSVDEASMYVRKLYVQPASVFGIAKEPRLIDRDQIVEITDKKIIVSDSTVKAGSPATAPAGS